MLIHTAMSLKGMMMPLIPWITTRTEIFARHCLASRIQRTGESVNEYLQFLKQMSKVCHFKPITAELYKNEYIKDPFIHIRERLLENATITLENSYDQARALELTEQYSALHTTNVSSSTLVDATEHQEHHRKAQTAAAASARLCKWFLLWK